MDKKNSEVRQRAELAIRQTERALRKHIGLVKKRERIASVVATIERLRGDLMENDARSILEHLEKLNTLTQGFSGRAIQKKKK